MFRRIVLDSPYPDQGVAQLIYRAIGEPSNLDPILVLGWGVAALVARRPQAQEFSRRMLQMLDSNPFELHEGELVADYLQIVQEIDDCESMLVFKQGHNLYIATSADPAHFDEFEKELKKARDAANQVDRLLNRVQRGSPVTA